MDELTEIIKKNIKDKFSSTRQFAEKIGIPQTTIVSALKNGVSGTSFTTVCKICSELDIKFMDGMYPVEVTDSTKKIVEKLSKLDEKGIHTVSTVLEMEYLRCQYEAENIAFAESTSRREHQLSYPVIENSQIPTKSSSNNLLKALNDDEDALMTL